MIDFIKTSSWASLVAGLLTLAVSTAVNAEPIHIGSQLEPFVSGALIERMERVRLELQRPISVGKIMDFEAPWEGDFTFYPHIFHDG